MDEPADQAELVRAGYDALSYLYRGDADSPAEYAAWIDGLVDRLPRAARVLDLGCGCGVPVSRDLVAAGHAVTGVDLSDVQIGRARRLVPAATFLRADATRLDLPEESFDAVVCLYTLIHVPLHEQQELLASIARWLAPGGWLLMTAGWRSWTGSEQGWLGGTAAMWWSHADADTYRRWLGEAGFSVRVEAFVPEGDGGHSLFWARKATGHPADD